MALNISIPSYSIIQSIYLKIKQEVGTLLHGRSLSSQSVLLVSHVCLFSNERQSSQVKKLAKLIKDININRTVNLNKASGASAYMYCKAANPEKSKKMNGPAGILSPVTYWKGFLDYGVFWQQM